MNIIGRESLNDYSALRQNNNVIRINNFSNIKRFLSVGFSTIYTATAGVNGRNGIAKGDRVYFKINNELGVNRIGRIDESSGSCEDVAEVMGFYTLRNLQNALGKESVLKTTPYDFADYEHDNFYNIIAKKTADFVEDDRLYGCISKDCVSPNAEILHGDAILSLVVPNNKVVASSSNTLFNYNSALGELSRKSAGYNQDIIIDPISTRYLANTMFWDYFFLNSDRHCKNINFERIPLTNGQFLVTPLAIIDNGGGLCMQSTNCKEFFSSCSEEGLANGFYKTYSSKATGPFCIPYELSVGQDSYPDGVYKDAYEGLTQGEQIVVLLSGNRTLYNDFANMYKNLSFEQAIKDMQSELRFNPEFLPNLSRISTEILDLKKAEVSSAMADFMSEEFNYETFLQDPNHYIDKFQSFVAEDELNLHIATNEEVEEFNIAIAPLLRDAQTQQEPDAQTYNEFNDGNSLQLSKTSLEQNDYAPLSSTTLTEKTGETNVSLIAEVPKLTTIVPPEPTSNFPTEDVSQ